MPGVHTAGWITNSVVAGWVSVLVRAGRDGDRAHMLLSAMQYWQFQMAQRATELERARSLYQKATALLDRGDRTAEPEAAMAKAYGTRLANDLVREAAVRMSARR